MFVSLFWIPSNFLIFLSDLKVSIPVLSLVDACYFCTENHFFFRLLYLTYHSSISAVSNVLKNVTVSLFPAWPMTLHVPDFRTLCGILLQVHVQFLIHFYSPNERQQCREPAGTWMLFKMLMLSKDLCSSSNKFLHCKEVEGVWAEQMLIHGTHTGYALAFNSCMLHGDPNHGLVKQKASLTHSKLQRIMGCSLLMHWVWSKVS